MSIWILAIPAQPQAHTVWRMCLWLGGNGENWNRHDVTYYTTVDWFSVLIGTCYESPSEAVFLVHEKISISLLLPLRPELTNCGGRDVKTNQLILVLSCVIFLQTEKPTAETKPGKRYDIMLLFVADATIQGQHLKPSYLPSPFPSLITPPTHTSHSPHV